MTDLAAAVAAVIYVAAVVLLLAVQTWRHRRRTGSTGFNGFRERGPAARIAGIGFVVAVLAGLVAPLLTAVGLVPRVSIPVVVGAFGLVVAAAGLQLGMFAQRGMGRSWRIGVDSSETTDLVTDGLFGVIRNPIFTALLMIQVGTAAMALNWLSLAGAVVMLLACQLQTRLVEEPYLVSWHGQSYLNYASHVGRFIPGVGRLRSGSTASHKAGLDPMRGR